MPLHPQATQVARVGHAATAFAGDGVFANLRRELGRAPHSARGCLGVATPSFIAAPAAAKVDGGGLSGPTPPTRGS